MLHAAGNVIIRYIGTETKKLWEVGGRNVPIVNEGDMIVVDGVTAATLCRNRFFEKAENAVLSVVMIDEEQTIEENQGEENQGEENQGEENQGEENPPADSEESSESVQEEVVSEEETHEAAESVDSKEAVAEATPKKRGK